MVRRLRDNPREGLRAKTWVEARRPSEPRSFNSNWKDKVRESFKKRFQKGFAKMIGAYPELFMEALKGYVTEGTWQRFVDAMAGDEDFAEAKEILESEEEEEASQRAS